MLSRACGATHPAHITGRHIEVLDGRFGSKSINELFDYKSGYGLPSSEDLAAIDALINPGRAGS